MNCIVNIRDKKVVITGAGSGIGRECAIVMSEQGARVIMLDLNMEGLQETCAALNGEGHITISCDLSDFDRLPVLVKDIIDKTGPIDGFVHCAGISSRKPLNVLKAKAKGKPSQGKQTCARQEGGRVVYCDPLVPKSERMFFFANF